MGKEAQTVLIVEARNPTYFNLAKRGFVPESTARLVASHAQAINALSKDRFRYKALVCDLDEFGTMDGINDALKEARYYGGDIPIIVRTEPEDRKRFFLDPIGLISILEAGADNVMPKTANPDSLAAHINALNRRQELDKNGLLPSAPVTVNDVTIDFTRKQVLGKNGRLVKLNSTEWRLLTFMYGHKGQVLPHDRILAGVWSSDYVGNVALLRWRISRLRKRLPGIISTKPGFGYIIEDPKPISN